MQKTKIPKEVEIKGKIIIEKASNGKDFNIMFVNEQTGHYTMLGNFYYNFPTRFSPSTRFESVGKLMKTLTRPQEHDFIPDLSPLFSIPEYRAIEDIEDSERLGVKEKDYIQEAIELKRGS